MSDKIGLVLAGGGARAAYQAGVLKGIASILGTHAANPFSIVTGISAGAINGATIAAGGKDFDQSVDQLCDLWSKLTPDRVMSTNLASLTRLGTRWVRDLSLSGIFGGARSTFLIDVRPLKEFLAKTIQFGEIEKNLQSGQLHGFAVSATNYGTGTAVTFFEGAGHIKPWMRSNRIGIREKIALEHILGSAAIPILFPPVKIKESFYGDGSVGLSAPVSPAIHLGADRVLVIGNRYQRPSQETWQLNLAPKMSKVALADIAGVLLNTTFFDMLESDLERMERINSLFDKVSKEEALNLTLKRIPLLALRPSQDLGSLASERFDRLPLVLRYLLAGIGASHERGWDLLSYMAFDNAYTAPLIELGIKDAMDQSKRIEQFFA